jgi:F-type H+-transporting ATPase subunit a
MTAFLNKLSRFSLILTCLFLCVFSHELRASETDEEATEKFNASEVILHHVMDDHVWHIWDGHNGTIYLPVIVYSSDR